MEDEAIVKRYLARDSQAITATAEKYGKSLRSIARGITGDVQAAEECENETYFSAWNAIPPHEPWDYLFAFLARITRQTAISYCRKESKRQEQLVTLSDELALCIPAPADGKYEARALAEEISRFLLTQSKEKRVLFVRRYFYLDTICEISQRFGFSESKVKTTLHRTRRLLREYLIKEGYDL